MSARPPRDFKEWMRSVDRQLAMLRRVNGQTAVATALEAIEAATLAGLTDTAISETPVDGSSLVFSSGGWADAVIDLSTLPGVNITENPVDGTKALVYDTASGKWEPAQVVAEVGAQGTTQTRRTRINFVDEGFTVTDNPETDSTDVNTDFVRSSNVPSVTYGATRPASPALGHVHFPI